MRKIDLERAFPQTPTGFHQSVEQTLLNLKEEPMKKSALRVVMLAALITTLLAGIAYAVIQYGQEWSFDTRFTNFQNHKPEEYRAIVDGLQKDLPYQVTGPATELVELQVLDAAWAPKKSIATLSLLAFARDEGGYELHDLQEMDTDGALVGRIDPDDEESRMDHWLWTTKGFGLPKDTMIHPEKQLLLINNWGEIFIGESDTALPMGSSDSFTTSDGPVMSVYMFDLDLLDSAAIDAMIDLENVPEGYDKTEYNNMQKETLRWLKERGAKAAQAIIENTDDEGFLSLRYLFSVQTFQDNSFGEEIPGEIRFKVKIR